MKSNQNNDLTHVTDDEAGLIQRIARHPGSPVMGKEPPSHLEAAAYTLKLLDSPNDFKLHDQLIKKKIVVYWDDGEAPVTKLTPEGFEIYRLLSKHNGEKHNRNSTL